MVLAWITKRIGQRSPFPISSSIKLSFSAHMLVGPRRGEDSHPSASLVRAPGESIRTLENSGQSAESSLPLSPELLNALAPFVDNRSKGGHNFGTPAEISRQISENSNETSDSIESSRYPENRRKTVSAISFDLYSRCILFMCIGQRSDVGIVRESSGGSGK